MAGITGNFLALHSLRDKVAALRQAGFGMELSQVLGGAAMKQLADEFRQSRDPYGRPWLPPKYRPGGKPLMDKGNLRRNITMEPSGSGVKVTMVMAYAPVHQYGHTFAPRRPGGKPITIPRRQMLPMKETGGFGDRWTAAFRRETSALLSRRLGMPGRQAGG